MATGFGIQEIEDSPGVFVGTTPEDIQLITASEYQNAGILTGAVVQLHPEWKYSWTSGAAVVDLGSDRAVRIPIYEGSLTPDPAPATGERTDTIYAEQVVTARSNLVRVAVTTGAAPARAIVLDRIRVKAGDTRTNQGTRVHDRAYARHSQSTQGRVASVVDTGGDVRTEAGGAYERCKLRFFVDTDRTVAIRVSTTISRVTAEGGWPPKSVAPIYGSVMYRIYVDGRLARSFERVFNSRWVTQQFETIETVARGAHTVHITSEMQSDNEVAEEHRNFMVRYGGADKHPGDAVTVVDYGVAV